MEVAVSLSPGTVASRGKTCRASVVLTDNVGIEVAYVNGTKRTRMSNIGRSVTDVAFDNVGCATFRSSAAASSSACDLNDHTAYLCADEVDVAPLALVQRRRRSCRGPVGARQGDCRQALGVAAGKHEVRLYQSSLTSIGGRAGR